MLCVVRDALKVVRSMSHKTREDEVVRGDGKGRNFLASCYKGIDTHGTHDTHVNGGAHPKVSPEMRWCEMHSLV